VIAGEENQRSLNQVIESSSGITVVVGFADAREDIYNAAKKIVPLRHVGVRKSNCFDIHDLVADPYA
jgi:ribosomal protein S3AE